MISDRVGRRRRLLRRQAGSLLPACLWLAVAAAAAPAPPAAPARADLSYAGTLPCAGCAAEQVTLTLFGDHTFRMRTRSVDAGPGRGADRYDLGRWGREGERLVLRGGREAPWQYAVGDDGALRPLDAEGRPVGSAPGATLQRQAAVERIDGPMRLRGLYGTVADAAALTECLTGRRWPVAADGEHPALARAAIDARAAGGAEPVLAAIVGRFELRAPEPGLLRREVLRVERFERLWPGETCAADAPAAATLVNQRWRVVEIDGQPVAVARGRREPFVLFASEGNRIRGFGGCNSFAGRFALGADGIEIRELSASGAACADDGQEARLLDALGAAAARQIAGEALQLRDAGGRVRVRAETLHRR